MRSTRLVRTAAAVLGVLLVTAACVGPPAADAPPPLPGMTPVPVLALAPVAPPPDGGLALTAEQIGGALLGAADVPADWHLRTAPQPDAPTTSLGFAIPDATSVDPAPCLDMGLAGGPTTPQTAFTRVGFYTADLAYVSEEVSTWPDAAAGAGMIAAARSWVASCPQFTVASQDGSVSSFHLTQLTMPVVGDQVVGLRVEVQRTAVSGDVVAFTVDTTIVAVGHVVVGVVAGGEATLDPALFAQLVTTATAKVQAASA